MNKVALAWRSLGRVRQTALLVFLTLVTAQTWLAIANGLTAWLPAIGLVALIGLVTIHQSSIVRTIVDEGRARARSARHIEARLRESHRVAVATFSAINTVREQLDDCDDALERAQEGLRSATARNAATDRGIADLKNIAHQTSAEVNRGMRATATASGTVSAHIDAMRRDIVNALTLAQQNLVLELKESTELVVAGSTAAQTSLKFSSRIPELLQSLASLDRSVQQSITGTQHAADAATSVGPLLTALGQTVGELRSAVEKLEISAHEVAAETGRGATLASDTLTAVRNADRRLERAFDGGNSHSLERRIVAEVSALMLLQPGERSLTLPPVDGWAMSPLAIHFIESEASKLGSGATVVELGSGVSTAWIGLALSQMENAPRFIAVEHDEVWADITAGHLERMGITASASVVLAPLCLVDDIGQQWYGTEWIEGVSEIGLLIVDGPPAGTQKNARYPALPLLVDRLADQATIFVDDADRPGEADMVTEWLKLPGVTRGRNVGRSLILHFVRES